MCSEVTYIAHELLYGMDKCLFGGGASMTFKAYCELVASNYSSNYRAVPPSRHVSHNTQRVWLCAPWQRTCIRLV